MQIKAAMRYILNPIAFAEEVLGFTPDDWQREIMLSASKRMLLNCCRQSGKSTTTAIIALHRALFWANSKILLVSPSQKQSSELFRKVMGFYRLIPNMPKPEEENKLSLELRNGSRIISLPSNEDTIRGYSAVSILIEDEASRVSDELYKAVRPMLAVSGGRLVLLSTPHGETGHFYNEWHGDSNWLRMKITANDCPRISKEFLEEERQSLGDAWFKSEYMGEFIPDNNQLFSRSIIEAAFSNSINSFSFLDDRVPASQNLAGEISKRAISNNVQLIKI
ncbi:MAG: hypothetical protein HQL06_10180 [Nitrospirae bacterium]|nr:hypothetical protein [Nitrospirota bacterium]